MDEFICKIATREDVVKRWDALIANNSIFNKYRQLALDMYDNNTAIIYYGQLNGETICEMTAYIKEEAFKNDIDDPSGLLSDKMSYLAAFRTDKEYEGKGYFSKLYHYVEDDLRKRGYTEVSLGVGPENIRGIIIYFHLGFTNYIKTAIQDDDGKEDVIIFYKKDL